MGYIAVVNDDTVFLDMMTVVLSEYGWNARAYKEGKKAYAELKGDPPDLIILDIRMGSPEAGWALLELITLDRVLRAIPVIVCSGAILDLRAHQDWLSENGIAVLPKPFNIDQLIDRVRAALGPPRTDAG